MTIFDRIIARVIPPQIVHETDELIAFLDVRPQAPVHVLIVPKRCIVRLGEATGNDAELLGQLLAATPEVAKKVGVAETGFRIVINSGRDAGESVPHLHVHLLGGRGLGWPPG